MSQKFLLLLFALCLAVSLPAKSQTLPELQEASRLLKSGQAKQALDRVNTYLTSRPKDPVARFIKGLALTELGQTNEAIQTFQSLTEDHPELPEPYNNLAVLYGNKGQFEKARLALELAIQTHPSYSTAHENLGDIYAKMASQSYDKALQLDRSNQTLASKLTLVRELFSTQAKANVAPRTSLAAATTAQAPAASTPAKPANAPAPVAPTSSVTAAPAKSDSAPLLNRPETAVSGRTETTANGDPAPVLAAVTDWAKHWSNRDVDAYLSAYSQNFKPHDGSSRSTWAKRRRERVRAPRSINVKVLAPEVKFDSPTQATVVFRQSYASDTVKSQSRKTLKLVREGERWLIVSEKTG